MEPASEFIRRVLLTKNNSIGMGLSELREDREGGGFVARVRDLLVPMLAVALDGVGRGRSASVVECGYGGGGN